MSLSSVGKKHDAAILADSDLLTTLEQYAVSPTGQAMCIYGDPAYPLRVNLMAMVGEMVQNSGTLYTFTFTDILIHIRGLYFHSRTKIVHIQDR